MNELQIEKQWLYYIKHLYKQLTINNKKTYGGGITSNMELNTLGKQYLNKDFIGVFAVNSPINLDTKKKVYFIINNDTMGRPGEHWISVVKSGKNIYIHDTFGRPSKRLLKMFYDRMINEGYTIKDCEYDKEQKPYQEDCGVRSVASLMIAKKYGVKAFLKL